MVSPILGSPRCPGWASLNRKDSWSSIKFEGVSLIACPHLIGGIDLISLTVLVIGATWNHDSFSEIQETND